MHLAFVFLVLQLGTSRKLQILAFLCVKQVGKWFRRFMECPLSVCDVLELMFMVVGQI